MCYGYLRCRSLPARDNASWWVWFTVFGVLADACKFAVCWLVGVARVSSAWWSPYAVMTRRGCLSS